jgi:hypothetical protein
MLVLILTLLLSLVLVITGILINKSVSFDGGGYWIGVGIGILLVPIFTFLYLYPTNVDRSAYLESFYYTNVNQYEIAADLTASYLSEDNFVEQIIAGSIEKQQLATEISNRIAEWRDGIVAYNQILATYQKWDNNILVGIFIPNLDPNLKYLQIGQE